MSSPRPGFAHPGHRSSDSSPNRRDSEEYSCAKLSNIRILCAQAALQDTDTKTTQLAFTSCPDFLGEMLSMLCRQHIVLGIRAYGDGTRT